MARTVTVRKHSFDLENLGVDYTIHDMGLSLEIQSWPEAFRKAGFERITREEAEQLVPFDKPMELQDSNTYNDTDNVTPDINYGLNEIPEQGVIEAGMRGDLMHGTLLVFKVHKGGDIRGSYGQNMYMVSEMSEEELIHELARVLSPEINVEVEDEQGNTTQARIGPRGYTEFMENELDLDDRQIMDLMEETGGRKTATTQL